MLKASDVMDRVRALLNDVSGNYFTNTILLPYLKIALDDLRGECIDNNIPYTNSQSAEMVVTTAMTDIGGSTGPALPSALIEIQEIFERTSGSSEDWTTVERREFLPINNGTLYQQLLYWSWQEQIIKFNGALSDREIRINYIKDTIADVLTEDSIIELIESRSFLSYRTAGVTAEFAGEDQARAASLNGNASRELDQFINLSIKGAQVIPTRRKPFMAGYRGRYR